MSNRYIFSDTLAIFRSLFVTYTPLNRGLIYTLHMQPDRA